MRKKPSNRDLILVLIKKHVDRVVGLNDRQRKKLHRLFLRTVERAVIEEIRSPGVFFRVWDRIFKEEVLRMNDKLRGADA